MKKKIAEVRNNETTYILWRIDGEGFVIHVNGEFTADAHYVTAPNEEIAKGYFDDYVIAMR